jgi:hypothetical protein
MITRLEAEKAVDSIINDENTAKCLDKSIIEFLCGQISLETLSIKLRGLSEQALEDLDSDIGDMLRKIKIDGAA